MNDELAKQTMLLRHSKREGLASNFLRVCFRPAAVRRMVAPSTDRYVPAVPPSPREIDMMAIGSFSKALAGPLVRKVTTEIKEGA